MSEILTIDELDYCLVCDKEIPPGPDFCSDECAVRAREISEKEASENLHERGEHA